MDDVRTYVTFKSAAYNTTEPKDHYYHPNNFGDDLAEWLMQALEQQGYQVGEGLKQEDHGWYFTFWVGDRAYQFIVGYRGEEEWLGWVERKLGLLASLFGGRKRGIQPQATQAIKSALSSAPEIRAMRWHFEQDLISEKE
jgi:hypothetical protein